MCDDGIGQHHITVRLIVQQVAYPLVHLLHYAELTTIALFFRKNKMKLVRVSLLQLKSHSQSLSALLSVSPYRHVNVRNLSHNYVFTLKMHPTVNSGTIAFSLPQVGVAV